MWARAFLFLISWSIQPKVVAVCGPAFMRLYFGVSSGGASKTFWWAMRSSLLKM